MADIRIKDLTTTASSTASDDFIAVDGTTNGTRKLSAFSPTFGGNATVTGTLTTNGNVTINSNVGIIGKSGTGTGGNWRFVSDDGNSRWLTGLLGGSGETSYSIYDSVNTRSLLTATAAGVVQINQTTASTTTSSGALVVSGGVGVAKEMYIGGGLLNVAKGGAGSTIEINADSGFASKLAMQRAATNRWTLEVDSSDVLTIKSLGTTAALTMTGTTSAEFVGSIKTAAPSGGTAANWKLGTVATVSPTSPNRTIEVDIGGTIYYLAAKTTNN